ncbi:MAG: hypothetical protein IJ358_02375 [Clostridia bacterium]|nr:hypothetical protein [Clostridia bacterium]
MKKFKFIPVIVCMIMLAVALTGCNLFKDKYKNFQVQYTPNLQLLLGEEWHDDQIKGTATKSDDTTEDVTSKMTIDTSEYNKDQVGKYKIYFEFEGIKLDYEVEVVSELTNATFISERLYKVMQNSLVAKDGVLSFDATMSQDITYMGQSGQVKHTMYYREDNSIIDVYYKWELVNPDTTVDTVYEIWYNGTVDDGIMTIDYQDGDIESGAGTLEDFDALNELLADELAVMIDASVNYIDIAGIQTFQSLTTYTGTLTKNANLYTLAVGTTTITYSNNKLATVNSVNFAYNTTNTIPTAPVVE